MCMHHIIEASATVEVSEPCAIIGRADCSKYHEQSHRAGAQARGARILRISETKNR
jgi:hypothetical protein